MKTFSKTLIAAAAFAAIATTAFSQVPWDSIRAWPNVCRSRQNVGDGHGVAGRITTR